MELKQKWKMFWYLVIFSLFCFFIFAFSKFVNQHVGHYKQAMVWLLFLSYFMLVSIGIVNWKLFGINLDEVLEEVKDGMVFQFFLGVILVIPSCALSAFESYEMNSWSVVMAVDATCTIFAIIQLNELHSDPGPLSGVVGMAPAIILTTNGQSVWGWFFASLYLFVLPVHAWMVRDSVKEALRIKKKKVDEEEEEQALNAEVARLLVAKDTVDEYLGKCKQDVEREEKMLVSVKAECDKLTERHKMLLKNNATLRENNATISRNNKSMESTLFKVKKEVADMNIQKISTVNNVQKLIFEGKRLLEANKKLYNNKESLESLVRNLDRKKAELEKKVAGMEAPRTVSTENLSQHSVLAICCFVLLNLYWKQVSETEKNVKLLQESMKELSDNDSPVPPPASYTRGPASYPPSYGAPTGGYGGYASRDYWGGGRGGPQGGYGRGSRNSDGGRGRNGRGALQSSDPLAKLKQCDENCGDSCDNATIYISNLTPDVTVDELRNLFESNGTVARVEQKRGFKHQWPWSIKLYTDESGKNKGDGVLSYENPSAAHSAGGIFQGHDLRGYKISVAMAEKSAPKPFVPGGGVGVGGSCDGSGRDDDWRCPNTGCGNLNFAGRTACNKCGEAPPSSEPPAKVTQCDENCGDSCDHARIYISNLPPDVTVDELRELFENIGTVAKIKLYTDESGKNKGDGVLSYAKPLLCRVTGFFFEGHDLRGYKISVAMAEKSAPKPFVPGGGYDGGGGD